MVGWRSGCALCSSPVFLKHIVTGCKVSLIQGHYTWHHSQVLKSFAFTLEEKCITTSEWLPSSHPSPWRGKSNQEQAITGTWPASDSLQLEDAGGYWLAACFPHRDHNLYPQVWYSSLVPSVKKVFISEFTVPWEDSLEKAYERKYLRYAELAAEI